LRFPAFIGHPDTKKAPEGKPPGPVFVVVGDTGLEPVTSSV